MGFLGMLVPEAYGGSAAGNFALVLALEEINRACASTGVTMSVQNSLVTAPIVHWASRNSSSATCPDSPPASFSGRTR